MPGPAPKPQATRRRTNAAPPSRTLPSEGRSGSPPAWPLSAPADDEVTTWAHLWSLPQAVEWERLQCSRLVARYCRGLVVAEQFAARSATLLGEIRQMEDRLGLTPMSMLRLRWEVGDAAPATVHPIRGSKDPRRRFQSVDQDPA